MSRHLKYNKIIDFILDGEKSSDYSSIYNHISSCEKCNSTYKKLIKIHSHSNNSKIDSSPALLSRINGEYDRIVLEKSKKIKIIERLNPYFNRLIKPAMVFATLLIVPVMVLFYNRIFNYPDIKNIKIQANLYDTTNHSGIQNLILNQKNTIKTSEKSIAILKHSNLFKITLMRDSIIEVTKSHYSSSNRTYHFSFNLKKGYLYGDFNHSKKINYSFKTENALIDSIGTKFILKKIDGKTELSLIEGKVNITDTHSREKITATQGKKYSVNKKISATMFSQNDLAVIEKIKSVEDNLHTSKKILTVKKGNSSTTSKPKIKSDKNSVKKETSSSSKKDRLNEMKKDFREQKKFRREMMREQRQTQIKNSREMRKRR